MKAQFIFLKSILLYVVFFILQGSASFAQKRFLLNEADMPGYQLLRTETVIWRIRPDSLKRDIIEQTWGKSGQEECYISYGEFDCEADALNGTSSELDSYAAIFLFGSPTGEISGNASWVSMDRNGAFFQKGNVGIKIIRPVMFDTGDPYNLLNISKKVLERISDSISTEILEKDLELLNYRLALEDYNQNIKPCNDSLIEKGYIETKVENSKWVFQNDSLQMGLRKQWSNDHSFFSIDVTRYSNDADAQIATENRGQIAHLTPCLLNDTATITLAINDYFKFRDKQSMHLSAVGRIGKYAIHFYYFDEKGVDIELFKKIVQAVSKLETGLFSIENTELIVYPNPATDFITIEKPAGNLDNYIFKVMDLNGKQLFMDQIELSPFYKFNLSWLNKGTYLLRLENRKKQMTKLIIKK